MNSAFVVYEELSRSRRVLSAEVDNTPTLLQGRRSVELLDDLRFSLN